MRENFELRPHSDFKIPRQFSVSTLPSGSSHQASVVHDGISHRYHFYHITSAIISTPFLQLTHLHPASAPPPHEPSTPLSFDPLPIKINSLCILYLQEYIKQHGGRKMCAICDICGGCLFIGQPVFVCIVEALPLHFPKQHIRHPLGGFD